MKLVVCKNHLGGSKSADAIKKCQNVTKLRFLWIITDSAVFRNEFSTYNFLFSSSLIPKIRKSFLKMEVESLEVNFSQKCINFIPDKFWKSVAEHFILFGWVCAKLSKYKMYYSTTRGHGMAAMFEHFLDYCTIIYCIVLRRFIGCTI